MNPQHIIKLRLEENLSVAQIAERIGKSRTYIYNILKYYNAIEPKTPFVNTGKTYWFCICCGKKNYTQLQKQYTCNEKCERDWRTKMAVSKAGIDE